MVTINRTEYDEAAAREMLADFLQANGLGNVQWPMDTADVAEVLHKAGYVVTPKSIRKLADLGQLPAVEEWTAEDVFCLAASLERRRDWGMTPNPHDAKKTATRLALEMAIIDGDEAVAEMVERLKPIDLRLALVLFANAETRELREKMLTSVQLLLADRGIVDC